MKKLFFLLFLLCSLATKAQELPAHRLTDWTLAGFKGEIPQPQSLVDVVQQGADPLGNTDCSALINRLMADAAGKPTVVFFPPGSYLFKAPLNLPSHIVLRGAGAALSLLRFDLAAGKDALVAKGSTQGSPIPLSGLQNKGSKTLLCRTTPPSLAKGDIIYVKSPTTGKICQADAWAGDANLQVLRVEKVEGMHILLQEPLRASFDSAVVQRIQAKTLIGIENLCVEILHADEAKKPSTFAFDYAHNCWITGVESKMANGTHVDIRRSANLQISGNYFNDAHIHGGGGSGYGICLTIGASQVLIVNNIFDHLRHAMLCQAFANGNVFAYNYSHNPYRTDFSPADMPADICLHGNWPYANLYQGNIASFGVADNPHASNGENNLFFRNRFYRYGIKVENLRAADLSYQSDRQNDSLILMGNEITNNSPGQYNLQNKTQGHFQKANNFFGTPKPSGSTSLEEKDFAGFTQKPAFWDLDDPYYGIGYPNTLGQYSIPAKARYDDPQKAKTVEQQRIFASPHTGFSAQEIALFWNRSDSGWVQIDVENDPITQWVLLQENKVIIRQATLASPRKSLRLDTHDLPNGTYILQWTNEKLHTEVRKFIILMPQP